MMDEIEVTTAVERGMGDYFSRGLAAVLESFARVWDGRSAFGCLARR